MRSIRYYRQLFHKWSKDLSHRGNVGWTTKSLHFFGLLLQKGAKVLMAYNGLKGIWIDVGAHYGEFTFEMAIHNPDLRVYAFEPNLKLAAERFGLLPNFVMIPMAVAEIDGSMDFFINANDDSSSLLPLNSEGVRNWKGGEKLRIVEKITVPTIRLDTFMNLAGIAHVDYLEIDAQGADLSIVKSAGDRLKDIHKITLEVAISPIPLYQGAASKEEIVSYLDRAGFTLIHCQRQSFDQEENLTFLRNPPAPIP